MEINIAQYLLRVGSRRPLRVDLCIMGRFLNLPIYSENRPGHPPERHNEWIMGKWAGSQYNGHSGVPLRFAPRTHTFKLT